MPHDNDHDPRAGSPPPVPDVADASLSDEPGDDPSSGHGRIGYGRWARFTPLLLVCLIVLGLGWLGLAQRGTPSTPSPPDLADRAAPEATLRLLDGSRLPLADLRGNVVVLNFWASWCKECGIEAPLLQQLHEETTAAGQPVKVVGVGVRTDVDDDARAFVRAQGLTYPIGRDNDTPHPGDGPIQLAYGVTLLPSTIFIRPDGIVDRFHIGQITAEQLRFAVDEAASPAD